MRFRRKKAEPDQATAESDALGADAAAPESDPDPSNWALPADAAAIPAEPAEADDSGASGFFAGGKSEEGPSPEDATREAADAHAEAADADARAQEAESEAKQAEARAEAAEEAAEDAEAEAQEKSETAAQAREGERDDPATAASPSDVSAARLTSPGVGLGDGPSAAAAASTTPRPAASASPSPAGTGGIAQERPELVVAGAFAGAFLFAKILKRLGG